MADSALKQLRAFTKVVADTGDFENIKKYQPQDSTTNPSLIKAVAVPDEKTGKSVSHVYAALVETAIKKVPKADTSVELAIDQICVDFGVAILNILDHEDKRVSTEVDAALSYDTAATIAKARHLIELYEKASHDKQLVGIKDVRKHVLIKIASTWEGIQAARELEKEGIHCNLTLLFSLAQAAACAEAGVTLISPFVGRITDFYKEKEKVSGFPPEKDPGIASVKTIYNYYKKHEYKTVVMGASFRSKEQVLALAGCDLLTISPALLEELANDAHTKVARQLNPTEISEGVRGKWAITEAEFKAALDSDEMAKTKLEEGIRKFKEDTQKLREFVRSELTK